MFLSLQGLFEGTLGRYESGKAERLGLDGRARDFDRWALLFGSLTVHVGLVRDG